MGEPLSTHIETRDDVVVAHLIGELDLTAVPAAGPSLEASVPASALGLVLDFTELRFIDSSGIAMLFSLVRSLARKGQEVRVVVTADGPSARLLKLVHFNRAAQMHGTVDEAVRAMAGSEAG